MKLSKTGNELLHEIVGCYFLARSLRYSDRNANQKI